MSGQFLINWAGMAVSLFNTVLLLWLGLTVLLNAERRTWGIWLTGGGLLMGAAFFVSHSAILRYGFHYVGPGQARGREDWKSWSRAMAWDCRRVPRQPMAAGRDLPCTSSEAAG